MSQAALTAKYRPQTFAQVAGQETLKAILSRAALEQRVAPAYLFSGTRGVGKTTLARIFAKALNCRTAPAAEPCNVCDQCRSITSGNAVDVVEIDGASNRGIDDVRRLKEVVGYAPMEGAFKIFIIDEAHMLSREAFNALLKTLEEPPARVTFIMATTEPHKFPATIISRCQHYVFKRLPEKGLVEHLCSVLESEGVRYEDGAVRLIARRGAGSVRDSMSLLGQVLALQDGELSEVAARSVLGLAGQEAFMRMLGAFRDGDALSLSRMLREMLDQGLDMGFFLRELSSLWRNLFMLRQSGSAALDVVDLPQDESRACLEAASGFSLQHIHASWQMTLEGQRRVLTSLEPALALELLLLNLAMLPRLLSLENVSGLARRSPQGSGPAPQGEGTGGASGSRGTGGGAGGGFGPGAAGGRSGGMPPAGARNAAPQSTGEAGAHEMSSLAQNPEQDSPARAEKPLAEQRSTAAAVSPSAVAAPVTPDPVASVTPPPAASLPAAPGSVPPAPVAPPEPESSPFSGGESESRSLSREDLRDYDQADEAAIQEAYEEFSSLTSALRPNIPASSADSFTENSPALAESASASQQADDPQEVPDGARFAPLPAWDGIFRICAERETPPWLSSLLRKVSAQEENGSLVLTAEDGFVADRLRNSEAQEQLAALLEAWCGRVLPVRILASEKGRKNREELREEVLSHPLVKEVEARFGAYIIDYGQLR